MNNIDLRFGDCLEEMAEIEDNSIDMVLTDPPYGTTACKWDSVIPLEPMWEQLKRIIKPTTPVVMTASQPFTTSLIWSNLEMYRYNWVWNKRRPGNPMLAKKQCLKVHEDIVIFYSKFGCYIPQGVFVTDGKPMGGVRPSKTDLGYGKSIKGDYKQTKSGYPKSIIEVGFDNTKNVHPTQKPVALMEYLIKTYTNEGDTVLDFTCGSGSTMVACNNLNRNGIGIDNGYCEKDKVINGIQIKGLPWTEITRLRVDGKI